MEDPAGSRAGARPAPREAVGSYQKGATFRSLAEVWNGSRWRLQASAVISGATSSQLGTVSCVSATDCEAAGDARTTVGTQVAVVEKAVGDHGVAAYGDHLLALRYSS